MKMDPSELFKALGVESRVKIIELLKSKGPLGVKSISSMLGVTPAAVSQHLKVLKQAGLVRSERKGYWIPYSIDEKAMENCCCTLLEVCSCGCKGSVEFNEVDIREASLKSLRRYKKELEEELRQVEARISELRSQQK